MKYTKKIMSLLVIFILMFSISLPSNVFAQTSKVDEILSTMSNEDKIAQMMMPSFQKEPGVGINNDNIREILSTYNFAGVILSAENVSSIESTMRFVDLLQDANRNNKSRLLISIDQEGGYVTRLGVGTNMPGNMALAATNNPAYAYNSAKIIGQELKALGINTDFAPVVDVNSNPSNPVIGIRSFSDDADTVATYSEKFMQGLQSEGIITSLKHFPGHGDTSTDTHTGLAIVNKTYNELKNNELIPFQKLVNSGTDMIMTAHIQYPNIETETYVSKKDGYTYTLPATLSKKILTDILREDMGYEGVIVTDALNMSAISSQFGLEDASIRAINAGADILLMPYNYDSQINEFKTYIEELADKIGTEIDEDNVNASVRRILKLKEEKGLLEEYDNSDLEENIANAKNIVSSKENHNEEFEIAKNAITMIKNDDNVLPLNSEDKTVILYEYGSHIEAVNNAIRMLKNDGNEINEDNISVYPFYDNTGLPLDTIKEVVKDAKNVIMIHSLYGTSGLSDPDLDKMNDLIDYIHNNGGKVIALSTQLPYDVVKFKNADAIVITYLANGIRFNLEDYEKETPKYGPNVIAGIYMLFTKTDNMNGVLPVNIYNIDSNNNYTDEILYSRNYGLQYEEDEIKVLSINTEGYGFIAFAKENEEIEYETATSAGTTIKGTYKVGAKAGDEWKFVKWTKNGSDYSTASEITISLDSEDVELVAIFEPIEVINEDGKIEKLEIKNNFGNAEILDNDEEIREKIELTEEETNAIESGKDIYVFVEVEDISDLVSTKDKKLVKTKLEDGSVVGMYLDINLFKQIEGKNKVKVEETNGKITISFEIPKNLRNYNRKFYIIRVHGTEVTKIIPKINGNILTFETDKFSTYALAYTDTLKETKTNNTITPTPINKTINPKTGDNIMLYISMLGLSIIGLAVTGFYVIKKDLTSEN